MSLNLPETKILPSDMNESQVPEKGLQQVEIKLLFSLDALRLSIPCQMPAVFLKKGSASLNLAQGPPCIKNGGYRTGFVRWNRGFG